MENNNKQDCNDEVKCKNCKYFSGFFCMATKKEPEKINRENNGCIKFLKKQK